MEDCNFSIQHICLKIECLMKAFKFAEADKFSATIMKRPSELSNHPKFLYWRGRTLIYNGNETLGKKFFQQALNFDPDLKECQVYMKLIKKSANQKEEVAAAFKEGKFAEAIEQYKECLELDPLNANFNS
mmetsp:Transcript_16038/g.24894  ORF Transcript_16038/g.24894 Transcript_16038/m.24894 type:complete len:130 (+) Transcript_16038:496-885(+)